MIKNRTQVLSVYFIEKSIKIEHLSHFDNSDHELLSERCPKNQNDIASYRLTLGDSVSHRQSGKRIVCRLFYV